MVVAVESATDAVEQNTGCCTARVIYVGLLYFNMFMASFN